MSDVLERFLRYVKIDTESVPDVETVPSAPKEFDLARLLRDELAAMGAQDVRLDDHCYVYATIPAAPGKEQAPVLGLISHMDTSPAISGRDVKPRIVKQYDGQDILLNEGLGIRLSPAEFPSLQKHVGEDLVVTDGTTLLGADDKAGVAEIMTLAARLLRGEIPHGAVRIAFTPDEEVGNGVKEFDYAHFHADYAYTVDGGELGEFSYENFNAAGLKLTVHGESIHPGSAKGRMRNAIRLAMEFESMLPPEEKPEYTEGYEGFYHLDGISGSVEQVVCDYIIRDHDKGKFEGKKQRVLQICAYLNEKYGEGTFVPVIQDSYVNMKEWVEPHRVLIDHAVQAMEELGISPIIEPIRGGTDGATLSANGLPCPNLCTGGYNFHGKYEYIPVQAMERTVDLLGKIVEKFAE